ncbi:MAG: Zinc transporter ZupT [Promethearchaeota archaeon]|nr:MAG: Zinc transporter ZupT [Candidatus Lokiarchaeota archaeon]
MLDPFWFAILLSFLAGLSTSLGGLIAFVIKDPGPKILSLLMGFSAGVMIFISFAELLQDGISTYGILGGTLFFLLGIIIMFLIDISLSHKYHFEENYLKEECTIDEKIQKTSYLVFLGVFIHNLPEGIATMVGTLENVEIGIILAIAIAIHNIPEGIAVSVPTCIAKDDKKQGFFWSFLSGMSEPIGAIIFGLIFLPFINDLLLAALLSMVGGIMVYVSVDELLPVAQCHGNEKLSIVGLVLGMFIMALSLSAL